MNQYWETWNVKVASLLQKLDLYVRNYICRLTKGLLQNECKAVKSPHGFPVMHCLKDILPILCAKSEQFLYDYSTQNRQCVLKPVCGGKPWGLLTATLFKMQQPLRYIAIVYSCSEKLW